MIGSSKPWSPYDLTVYVISFIEKYLIYNNPKFILDSGCGLGKWGYLIRTSPPYKGKNDCSLIGCDIYLPNLKWVKNYRVYDDVILCDICLLPLREKSVDLILACEIIEHLRKKEGYIFLDELDSIYRYAIIISTPGTFIEPVSLIDVKKGKATPFDLHKSFWSVNEFNERGYQVLGIGSKNVTIHYIDKIDITTRVKFFIKILLSSFSFLIADLGEMMIAIKMRKDILLPRGS